MENKKLWYAVQKDADDNEWGNGSFDLEEAVKMCNDWDYTQIAVIDGNYDEDGNEQSDPICTAVLVKGKDF
jgi:hypothetical protein